MSSRPIWIQIKTMQIFFLKNFVISCFSLVHNKFENNKFYNTKGFLAFQDHVNLKQAYFPILKWVTDTQALTAPNLFLPFRCFDEKHSMYDKNPLTWDTELRLGKKELVPPVTGAGETSSHSCWKKQAVNSSSWGVSANQVLCNACGRGQGPCTPPSPNIASYNSLQSVDVNILRGLEVFPQ